MQPINVYLKKNIYTSSVFAVGRRRISLNRFTIWISLPEFSHQPTDGSQIQTSRQVIHMQKQNIRNRQSKYWGANHFRMNFARCCAPFRDTCQFHFVFHDRTFKKTYSNGKSWCRCVSKIISSSQQGLQPLLNIPSLSSRGFEALSIRSNGKTTLKGQTAVDCNLHGLSIFLWPSLDKSLEMTLGSGAAKHKHLFGGQWNGVLITNPLVEDRLPPLATLKKPQSGWVCLECLCGNHAHKRLHAKFYSRRIWSVYTWCRPQTVRNKPHRICVIYG